MSRADEFTIPEHEVAFAAVRAQGAGGQSVNKVSNAVHLRFEVRGFFVDPELGGHTSRKLGRRDGCRDAAWAPAQGPRLDQGEEGNQCAGLPRG